MYADHGILYHPCVSGSVLDSKGKVRKYSAMWKKKVRHPV